MGAIGQSHEANGGRSCDRKKHTGRCANDPEGLMEERVPFYDRLFYPLCIGLGVSPIALVAVSIWTLA